jgi:hypothetical protein
VVGEVGGWLDVNVEVDMAPTIRSDLTAGLTSGLTGGLTEPDPLV